MEKDTKTSLGILFMLIIFLTTLTYLMNQSNIEFLRNLSLGMFVGLGLFLSIFFAIILNEYNKYQTKKGAWIKNEIRKHTWKN